VRFCICIFLTADFEDIEIENDDADFMAMMDLVNEEEGYFLSFIVKKFFKE
jgi:hypothetical protein